MKRGGPGGAWGRSRASIRRPPSARTGKADASEALAWAEEASAEEAAAAEAAAAEVAEVEAAAAEAATERAGAARGEVPALRHLTHRAVTRLSTVAGRLLSGGGNPA